VDITFDPDKRDSCLRDRGLDFADAIEVFAGLTIDTPDRRRDSGGKNVSPRSDICEAGWLSSSGRPVKAAAASSR